MTVALLLLAFGGPRSLDEVEPFLTRLFRGRKPSAEQLEKIKERYRSIGGSSPLPGITLLQAKALEERLMSDGYRLKSYVGMRYGHPLIEETLTEILKDGIHAGIALPMAPFRSGASTGAYIAEVNRIRKEMGARIEISFIEGWHSHPLFIEAIEEKIEEGLTRFTAEERKGLHLIFTAHSLPESLVENDSYVKDMEETVRLILKEIEALPWHIAFQSRGMGQGDWLGPDVESIMADLSRQKVRNILLIPVGFVADHIEVLYDIDVIYRSKAEGMGVRLERTASLNASHRFIGALVEMVKEHMKRRSSSLSGVF